MKKLFIYLAIMAIVLSSSLGCYFWWVHRNSASKLLIKEEKPEKTESKNEVIKKYDEWFSRDFSSEKQLFQSIRHALSNGQHIQKLPKLDVDITSSWVAISLFQEGEESIRWVSKGNAPLETINRIIDKLKENQNFHRFDVSDPPKCRIMLEVITSEKTVDFDKLNVKKFNENRFEPGITGFKFTYQDRNYIYMPTDATVYSHLTLRHTLNFLSKQIGLAQQTNRISERIKLLGQLPIKWTKIEGIAFITFGEDVIALYRGYPMPAEFSADKILEMTKASVEWVLDNMYEDGRFLYYYDGVNDTVIDHLHPNRTLENNYYNLLRHNGGIILLLKMYELTGEQKYLAAAKKAIGFLIQNLRQREINGRKAYYAYYNKKAKLGGTGTALIALTNYYRLTKDDRYNEYIYGLAEHILSRVTADGEMIGYYIHPEYYNGQPILEPNEQEQKQLFSFYYPGEALLGLAMFEHYMDLQDDYRERVRKTAKSALDFLVKERPVKYAELFKSLPSDGWLMQAIEEWSYDSEFQRPEYLDFVFGDALKMIENMYTEQDSPYYDYPGTFYYNYGDHAYPDGARGEGLISAYYLAAGTGNEELAAKLLEGCIKAAKPLMFLYNSEESTYMLKFPYKSIGSFRFKFTRQWVRIDSVQHTACFFIRLYEALNRGITYRNENEKGVEAHVLATTTP